MMVVTWKVVFKLLKFSLSDEDFLSSQIPLLLLLEDSKWLRLPIFHLQKLLL